MASYYETCVLVFVHNLILSSLSSLFSCQYDVASFVQLDLAATLSYSARAVQLDALEVVVLDR